MITRLHAAIIYVSDIERAKEFYVNKLGWEIVDDQGKYVSLRIGNGSHVALNAEGKSFQEPGKQTISVVSNDIDEDYQKVSSLGVRIGDKLETYTWGRYFSILDEDGNHIDVVQK